MLPSTLQSGLLEPDGTAAHKESSSRRFLKSFSVQGLAIIAVQFFSLAVVVTVLQQHQAPSDGSSHLRPQGGLTDLIVPDLGLPHKFAIKHVTPVQFQWQRGTCWDFTIISLLEHSYRVNGIRQGWLQPDTYVKFSQQALGAQLMRFCRNGHSKFCLSPGDDLWTGNSTEGAEVQLLYLVQDIGNMVLPHSVCPYLKEESGHDGVCDRMDEVSKVNPIQFKVKHMKTFYDRIKIKDHLRRHGLAMGISATLVGSHFYLPCLEEFTSKPGMYQRHCTGDASCFQCPQEHAYHNTKCCARIERPGYNMEGEFFSRDPEIDGGHAMTVVGYNDIFRTTAGDVGGWIVKNSWWDGKSINGKQFKHARGSHSMAYFMLEISDTDERAVCPNSYNPRNWYPCAGQNAVMDDGNGPAPSAYTFEHMVKICTNPLTTDFAQNQRRVLQLTCRDSVYCNTESGSQLFLINATALAGGLNRMCFLQQLIDKSLSSFCLPPLMVDDVPRFITPADHEVKENDRDLCGFYFFPYKLLEETTSMIGAQTYDIQGFEIDWSPSSYDHGDHLNPPVFDYSEIRHSTHKQRERHFPGDLPNQDSRQ